MSLPNGTDKSAQEKAQVWGGKLKWANTTRKGTVRKKKHDHQPEISEVK